MASSATIFIFPTVSINEPFLGPAGVDLAHQRLLPSSDRSRVVELREVKHAQYWRRLREQVAAGAPTDDFSRR